MRFFKTYQSRPAPHRYSGNSPSSDPKKHIQDKTRGWSIASDQGAFVENDHAFRVERIRNESQPRGRQRAGTTQDRNSDRPMRAIEHFGDRESSKVNIHVGPYGRISLGTLGGGGGLVRGQYPSLLSGLFTLVECRGEDSTPSAAVSVWGGLVRGPWG